MVRNLILLAVAYAAGAASPWIAERHILPRIVSDFPAATVPDDPDLPNALIIGDSISIGYTEPVRQLLAGKVDVFRVPENAGHTRKVIERLDDWLGSRAWDVIYFNAGLHDLRDVEGGHLVPIEEYVSNLHAIVLRLKSSANRVIFATTTRVPIGADGRTPGAELDYNAAAVSVMRDAGACVDDLNAAIAPAANAVQRPENVHFRVEGHWLLAREVANAILDGC